MVPFYFVGRDSAVCIATRYGPYGPGIESRWGRDFPHPSSPALGPTQPPIQWVQGLSRGQSGRGVALTTHTPSSTEVKEWVGLHRYSPSGPSWPVIGWTLPTFYRFIFYVVCKSSVFDTSCKIIESLKCNSINHYLFLLLFPSPIYSLPWGKSPCWARPSLL